MYVYSLQSECFPKKFYIGSTRNTPAHRLTQHNAGQVPYTSKFTPWRLVMACWFANEDNAVRFERYLKSASGRAFAKRHFSPTR